MNTVRETLGARVVGGGPQAGSALLAAVMVGAVAIALGLVVVNQAINSSSSSGRDRQRTAQVHAAEAGVDSAYYALQSGSTPCAVPDTAVGTAPDVTLVSAQIDYYTAMATEKVSCPLPAGTLPVKAVITSTARSTNSVGAGVASTRTMESEVLLSPSSGGQGYAIYSYDNFSVPNSFELSTDGVTSPDIYARGGYNCVNSAQMAGNVFASQGGAQFSQSCSIAGNLSVRDGINMSQSSRVGGTASSSRAGLQQSNTASVGRDALLGGTYGGNRSKVAGTIRENLAPADPIDQALPYIGFESTAWRSAGFFVYDVGTNCDVIKSGGGGWPAWTAATTPTVYYGNCALNYSGNNKDLTLKTNVALFLTGGVNISNNFGLASDNVSVTRKLWVISPAGTGAKPPGWSPQTCTGGGLNFSNQTDIDKSVNTFLYSCGGIQAANNTGWFGQIYGRQVTVANSFSMSFVSVAPVGVDLGGQPATPGYNVQVVYKRETV
jgi:hypothetical protein